MRSDQEIRLECLRLASERLGPGAPISELFEEANRLLVFVERLEVYKVNGKEMYGRSL